jgi:hypothetical protein
MNEGMNGYEFINNKYKCILLVSKANLKMNAEFREL